MTANGRSLELFFIDGRPDGMLTAEVFNWTGHVLMSPRTQIAPALARREASYTGVYLLLGQQDGEPLAYIGESEDISSRIRNHDLRKDWWSTAVLVTSAANNLHKAHVKYLESRLVEEAKQVGRVPLENGNMPPRSSLSEAAQANMETFLETLLMILPALRIDMFLKKTRPSAGAASEPLTQRTAVFELSSRKHGLTATAILEDGEFVVQAGSTARSEWAGPSATSYSQLYGDLKKTGILKNVGPHCLFTENYAFASPSAAAAVVLGRTSNGTLEWKVASDGRFYKQWEADQVVEKDTHP